MAAKARYIEVPDPLPDGIADRGLSLQQAAALSRRSAAQLHIDLERGRLRGKRLAGPRGWNQSAWEIRLSELSRYVRTMGAHSGPRPRKPTELDWERLAELGPAQEPAR